MGKKKNTRYTMLTIKINMHKHALLIEKNIFHYTTSTDKSMS